MIISVLQVSTQPQGLKSLPKVTQQVAGGEGHLPWEPVLFLFSLCSWLQCKVPAELFVPSGEQESPAPLETLSCHSIQRGPTAPENPQMHSHDPLSTCAYRHTHSHQHGLRTNAACSLWLSLFKGRKKETDETTDVFKSCWDLPVHQDLDLKKVLRQVTSSKYRKDTSLVFEIIFANKL